MSLRKVDEIFGYGFFLVGASKMIMFMLVIIKLSIAIGAIYTGGVVDTNYYFLIFLLIAVIQLILFIGSIVMIIISAGKGTGTIKGYLCGIGAFAVQFLVPKFLTIFAVSIECGLYMKAGNIIIKQNSVYGGGGVAKTTKKMIENTNWFYEDTQTTGGQDDKEQKRIDKIEKELKVWKELLDNKEIDEETYNYETQKLINKEKKIKAKNRPM